MKRKISSGAFGTIYEIEDMGNGNKTYALKELTNINLVSKQRFEREVKILSELDHPNIVKIFQWNMAGVPPSFSPYYIMEFLSGGSLRKYIDEKFSIIKSNSNGSGYTDLNLFDKRWTFRTIILPICNALSQAHSSNVFHRDLKPENILFTNATRSEIKIADWGLVKGQDYNPNNTNNSNHHSNKVDHDKLTIIDKESLELTAVVSEGNIGGTPDYCSPEQWFATIHKDTPIDARTDIFSIGVIFYELMTGRRPPTYDRNNADMHRLQINPPSKFNPTISPELDKCILKMIELKPENRHHSVWDLMSEIETLSDNSLG
ncbi:MAG TPA: serine/threonine-protein kinase [Nitrososphaeraceae archaeon]